MFDARLHQTNGGMAAESLRPVLPGREERLLFAHSCRSLVASERETIHLGFRGDRLQPSLEPTSKRRAMPAGRVRSAPPDDRKFELPTHCPTSQHFGPNKRANRLSNFARV